MSREREILSYLIEIKEDLATVKQQVSALPELRDQVRRSSMDIAEAKSSVSTLRWLFGMILLGAPTSIYAFLRIKGQ